MSPYRSNAVRHVMLEHLLATVEAFVYATETDPGWPQQRYQAVIEDLEQLRQWYVSPQLPAPMQCPSCGNAERHGGPGHPFIYDGLRLGGHPAAHCTRCGTFWSAHLTNATEAGTRLKQERLLAGDSK